MKSFIILIILVSVCYCAPIHRILRQADSTTPESSTENEDHDPTEDDIDEEEARRIAERGRMAAEYFPEPISRERAARILRRSLEILEKAPSARRNMSCSRNNDDEDAKNTKISYR